MDLHEVVIRLKFLKYGIQNTICRMKIERRKVNLLLVSVKYSSHLQFWVFILYFKYVINLYLGNQKIQKSGSASFPSRVISTPPVHHCITTLQCINQTEISILIQYIVIIKPQH